MKHEKKLSCLLGSVLAFVIALAGIGCIDSAFELYAQLDILGLYLALWAAFCGVCFYFRRGGTVFLCICAILLGFLIREGTLEQEVESLLFHLTRIYNKGYGCGIIYWTSSELHTVAVDGGLFVIGATILSILSVVLCRRKNELVALLAAIIPLGICLVVTDTIPTEGWLFLLLASVALLLLTHPVRKNRALDGIRLTAMLLVPVLLASLLLYALAPQDTYLDRMSGLQKFLTTHFYTKPTNPSKPGDGPGDGSGNGETGPRVNLANVGSREVTNEMVMDVLAESGQTLYLRDRSYDTYDGLSWETSEKSTGVDPYWPTEGLTNIGYVRISTRTQRDNLLLPYYIAAEGWQYTFVEGAYPNTKQSEYSFYQKTILEDGAGLDVPANYRSADLLQYLEIPEQTKAMWKTVLADVNIPARAQIAEAVQMIGEYVRSSAVYDLNAKTMPTDWSDFGLWFLQEGEGGYCIHFATAATMLLRAKGIPARYVTGYVTDVQRGVRKTVTGNEAHAWVEYLDPQLGWQILEATPGFSVVTPVPPEDPTPTDPTAPSQTDPQQSTDATETEPTETKPKPTAPQPTDPKETTAPTEATDPIEPGQSGLIGIGDGQGSVNWNQLRPVVVSLLYLVLMILLVIAQRGIRISRRRKRMYKGEPNQQARARWRFVLRLRRLTGQKLPEQLRELAERAAYSQHTLSNQELAQFDLWLESEEKILQARPWYLRFVYKWILAVI